MAGNDLHVLKIDLAIAKPGEVQPQADEATRRLFEETSSAIVKIETATATGTGFAVNRPGLIITDYHCIAGAREIKIRTPNGKLYRARVKDIDDINDLAVLEIDGKAPAELKPLKLAAADSLKPDDRVAALGHPEGYAPIYISPGYFVSKLRFGDKLFETETGKSPDEVSKDPDVSPKDKEDFRQIAERQFLYSRIHVRHGNSGGPLLDSNGNVVGVADISVDKEKYSHTVFTPVSDVHKMLNRETPKFAATYTHTGEEWTNVYKQQLQEHTLGTLGSTSLAGGAGYYGLMTGRKYVRGILPAALGLYGLVSVADDARSFSSSTNTRDYLKYGTATLADTSLLAGGAMRVFAKPVISATLSATPVLMESSAMLGTRGLMTLEGVAMRSEGVLLKQTLSKTGRIGVALLAAGLVTKLASDFIPNRLVQTDLSRTDGDLRPPSAMWGR